MAKSNKKFVNIKPHDATTIQIGEYVTVLDAVYDIDPELIQEMCKDAEPGEGHTFTMHPYIDVERAKGQIFKVESVNYPLVLCSHRDPCDNPLGPSVWDLRRVKLAPISGHYRRRMRAIYLATSAYHQALQPHPTPQSPKETT